LHFVITSHISMIDFSCNQAKNANSIANCLW